MNRRPRWRDGVADGARRREDDGAWKRAHNCSVEVSGENPLARSVAVPHARSHAPFRATDVG